MRAGRRCDGQFAAVAVHAQGRHEARDAEQIVVADHHLVDPGTGLDDAAPQRRDLAGPLGAQALGVLAQGAVAGHDLNPFLGCGELLDLDREGKAVQQLRAQFAFLGVHGADQDEAGRVAERDALALDDVLAHRGRVEQDVDQMVLEQVDLVDVEDAAVGGREQAGLEGALAGFQRALQIEGSDQPVLGGADRQFDEGRPARAAGQGLARLRARPGPIRPGRGLRGIVVVGRVDEDLEVGQELGQRAGGRGLGCATLAAHEHAADPRIDRGQQERQFHRVLADDGREGHAHGHGGIIGARAGSGEWTG